MTTNVLRLPGKPWFVCHSVEHGWGSASENGPMWFSAQANFVPLLPLLELPWPAANALVATAMKSASVDSAFPFESIVAAALAWEGGGYWPTLAVQWLEQGFALSVELRACLTRLSHNKTMPQRLRHRCIAVGRANPPPTR